MPRVLARQSNRLLRVVIVVALLAGIVFASAGQSGATGASVSLTASTSTLAPGTTVDLTAGMPVAAAGTVNQEIVQEIDPAKVRLTSAADITAPVGWTVQYFNGSVWSATAPTTSAGWAAITKVKASGTIVSDGASSTGDQVAAKTSSGVSLTNGGSVVSSNVGGDGWDVFFDPSYTRVFNRIHHKGGYLALDCHWLRTENGHTGGGSCFSGYYVDPAGFTNSSRSTGWVDSQNRMWLEMSRVSGTDPGWGFYCLDVSATSPVPCAGRSWYRLSAAGATVGMNSVVDLQVINGKLFTHTVDGSPAGIHCLDTLAIGGPAACAGQPYATSGAFVLDKDDILAIAGKLYVLRSTGASTREMWCIDPIKIVDGATASTIGCTGWPSSPIAATGNGPLLSVPDSSGNPLAVCTFTTPTCVDILTGSTTIAGFPSGIMSPLTTLGAGASGAARLYSGPATTGTKVYWPGNTSIYCFDTSANAMCSGGSWVSGAVTVANIYVIRIDPNNPRCIWTNGDTGQMSIWDGLTGAAGCTSISPIVHFPANVGVPRMACTVGNSVRQWQSFSIPLTGANSLAGKFTSAKLTVYDPAKNALAGWADVTIPGTGSLSLTSLPVSGTTSSGTAWTATDLDFRVTFENATYSVAPTATITAIGDAPQLCVHLTAQVVCPAGLGPIATIPSVTATSIASATATDASSVVTTLTPASTSTTVSAPAVAQCGGTLSGRAGTLTLGTTGDPVVGLTVTLLDSAGNVVTANGSPVTATTDASGNYTFGYLYPANYKVRFPDNGTTSAPAPAIVSSVTVATGGSGTVAASGACAASWTFDAATSSCVRTVTSSFSDVGAPTGSTLSYLVVGGGGGGAAYNAAGSRGGDGGAVVSGSVTTTGVVGVTIGSGGAAGASGAASALTGGASVSAAGGAGGGASSPAGTGTASSLSGTSVTYGVDGVNWSGAAYATAGGAGTANRGNGGGAGWRSYEGAGCYEPGAQHVYVNPGGPCGVGGTYENGGWSSINAAGAGGSGVVVLRYPLKVASNAATVPVGGAAVVNALYVASAIARPNTSAGAQDAVQTISVLADDTASTGATYSGGSTALKLCTSGQVSPNCTGTSLVISGQGSYAVSGTNITFTPCTGANTPVMTPACTTRFTGTATAATYQSTDSLGRIASSTVTPTVVPLPTASADAQTGAWDTNQTYTPLANDSAGSGATLATSPAGICLNTVTVASSCTSTTLTVTNQGTYTLNGNGTVTFDPLPSFNGVATAIKYAAVDSLGQKVLATITPTVSPPPPPTANPDTSVGAVGAAQTVNPFANDTAASGITFTATSVKLCSTGQSPPACTATSMVVSGKGSYSVNASTGVVTFTPCSGANTPVMSPACTAAFVGTAPAVTYQVTTSQSQVASSTYTATVVPPPTATADAQTAGWDVTQTFSPTSNDAAGAGASLVAAPFGICATSVTVAASCTTAGNTITISGQGTYTLNPSIGTVTFDPLPSWTGPATPIAYAVVDSLGQKSLATISPTVTSPPVPTALSETKTVIPGGSVNFTSLTGVGGLATTGGPTFATSATCLVNTAVTPSTCVTSLTISGEGVYTVNTATGVVTFTADQAILPGNRTPVSYRVTDATGQTATATLTPVVPPPPSLSPDHSVDEQNMIQILPVLANDSAASSTSLVPSSVKLCPVAATSPFSFTNCSLTSLDVSDVGRFTVLPSGSVKFEPCAVVTGMTCAGNYGGSTSFTGTTSPVRYVVADGVGQTASTTLTVEVLPPPVVRPAEDATTRPFGSTVVFDPLANDSGGTTTGLTGYTTVGTASVDSGTLRLCATGQTAPNCNATTVTAPEGTYVLSNATNQITFTPASNYFGTPASAPQYQVCNAIGGAWQPSSPPVSCAAARVIPTILPPAAPTASDDVAAGPYNLPLSFSVLLNDTKDGSLTVPSSSIKLCAAGQSPPNCSATSVDSPGEGTYAVNPSTGAVTFTPLPTFAGAPSVLPTYQFTDSVGQVASARISPTISPPLSPQATPQSRQLLPGTSVAFTNVIGQSGLASGTGLRTGAHGGPCLVDPADLLCKTSFSIANEGLWSVDQATGIVTFTADSAAATGPMTAVAYQVTDIVGQIASSLLSPSIPPAPVLTSDTNVNGLDEDQQFVVLTNDVAGAGTNLLASTLRLCGSGENAPNCVSLTVSVQNEGTYTLNQQTGVVTFDPLPHFHGPATPLTYQVSDSLGRTATSTVNPVVTALAPIATSDSSSGAYNAAQQRNLVQNDTADPRAALDPSTIRLCDPTTSPPEVPNLCSISAGMTLTVPSIGSYVVSQNGIVTFTPLPSFTGAAPAIAYQVQDAVGQYASALYTPTVGSPTPTALDDTEIGPYGTPLTFDPLANDDSGSLPNGVSGSVSIVQTSVRLCGPSESVPNCTSTQVVTVDGVYTVDISNGRVTFMPNQGFVGHATQPVVYQVANAWSGPAGPGISSATITPCITPVSSPTPGGPTLPGDPASPSDAEPTGDLAVLDSTLQSLLPATGTAVSLMALYAVLLLSSGAMLVVLSRVSKKRRMSDR